MIGLFTRNIGWKILSLLVAVLLYTLVIGEQDMVTSISVPIQYKNIPRDLELSSDVVGNVHLELRGPSNRMTPASLSETVVVLDLISVLRPGDRTYTIGQSTILLPSGVTFSRAVPAQVRLHFEERVWREVPVRVQYSSSPAPGYQIDKVDVRPSRLRIVGPESRVNQVNHVDTDSLDLSSLVGSGEFHVETYVPDSQVRFDSPSKVIVTVTVRRST